MRFIYNQTTLDNINDISIRILEGAYAAAREEWTGNSVRPPYTRLYYIISGDPYYYLNGRRVELHAGHVYLFPTGLSFRFACDTSMEQLYFHIRLHDANDTDMLRGCDKVMEYEIGHDKIRDLLGLFTGKTPMDAMYLKQEIYASVLTMLRAYQVPLAVAHFSRGVLQAIEYIKTHLSMKLTVSEVAANVFLSESTLSKKFKKEVGITMGGYIDEAVLFEAERLLVNTDLSVLQISERFGFCDQFYFSRRFKMKYGETPQRYRRMRLI